MRRKGKDLPRETSCDAGRVSNCFVGGFACATMGVVTADRTLSLRCVPPGSVTQRRSRKLSFLSEGQCCDCHPKGERCHPGQRPPSDGESRRGRKGLRPTTWGGGAAGSPPLLSDQAALRQLTETRHRHPGRCPLCGESRQGRRDWPDNPKRRNCDPSPLQRQDSAAVQPK